MNDNSCQSFVKTQDSSAQVVCDKACKETQVIILTRTELMTSKVAITQTNQIGLCDEDCQTEEKQLLSREVQVSFNTESIESGRNNET